MTSPSFAGFVLNNDTGHLVIKTVRRMVKSKNVAVRLFARNKNRKQFAKGKLSVRQLRQNLPVKYASHYGVYIYNDHKKSKRCTPTDIGYAKGVFDTLIKIYVAAGVEVSP